MMRVNVRRVIQSPRMVQTYQVTRTFGSWVRGRFISDNPKIFKVRGIVTVLSAKELQFLPEGDRVMGTMAFYSQEELYVTHAGEQPGLSDTILWHGNQYKIIQTNPWTDYGYYQNIGVRMEGV